MNDCMQPEWNLIQINKASLSKLLPTKGQTVYSFSILDFNIDVDENHSAIIRIGDSP